MHKLNRHNDWREYQKNLCPWLYCTKLFYEILIQTKEPVVESLIKLQLQDEPTFKKKIRSFQSLQIDLRFLVCKQYVPTHGFGNYNSCTFQTKGITLLKEFTKGMHLYLK